MPLHEGPLSEEPPDPFPAWQLVESSGGGEEETLAEKAEHNTASPQGRPEGGEVEEGRRGEWRGSERRVDREGGAAASTICTSEAQRKAERIGLPFGRLPRNASRNTMPARAQAQARESACHPVNRPQPEA